MNSRPFSAALPPIPRSSTIWRGLMFCVLATFHLAAAHAATLTVGQGAACQFNNLQNAIDASAEGDRIELEEAIYPGPFEVIEKSLSIVGGYESCFGDQVGVSRLSGNDAVRILKARATEQRRFLKLEHLYFKDGLATAANGGSEGGAIAVYGAVDLTLEKSWVVDNEAHAGGGLFARPAGLISPSVYIVNSEIAANRAVLTPNGARGSGGGIYYWHAGEGLEGIEIEDSKIDQNHADAYGGGLSVYNATLTFDRDVAVATMLIEDNTADVSGGAVAAWNSVVRFDGVRFPAAPEIGLEVRGNWALEDGGAVYLDASRLEADAVAFHGNTAQNGSGGAIAAIGGSDVVIGHGIDRCGEPAGCHVFEGNVARTYGGALVLDHSSATLLAVRANDNAALAGGAFLDASWSGRVEIWSSVLTRHEGQVLIYPYKIDSVDIRSSSFYDNNIWWTTIRPFGVGTRPTVSQSIFSNNGGSSYVLGDQVDFACNMIDGFFAWPSVRMEGFVAIPHFIDDTFRLEPGSPGDGCGYSTPSAPVDIDYQPRPMGISFDVGADER